MLVVHENRGLNPYIEDVARRAAVEGFLALAPDVLAPIGGYPGNDDDGKKMQRSLDRGKKRVDMLNGAKYLKSHALSNGKLGVTGFCWGGSTTNYLAVELGAKGISVNTVSAGFILTDAIDAFPDELGVREIAARPTPAGRVLTSADVSNVVAMLCGDDADMIRGQVIVVDGGETLQHR